MVESKSFSREVKQPSHAHRIGCAREIARRSDLLCHVCALCALACRSCCRTNLPSQRRPIHHFLRSVFDRNPQHRARLVFYAASLPGLCLLATAPPPFLVNSALVACYRLDLAWVAGIGMLFRLLHVRLAGWTRIVLNVAHAQRSHLDKHQDLATTAPERLYQYCPILPTSSRKDTPLICSS